MILVVDDDDQTRRLIMGALERSGYTTLGAPNGLEALRTLEKSPEVRLVCSDGQMPCLDGPGLFRELQRRFPEVGFVAVTGSEPAQAFFKACGQEFLAKPFMPPELSALIARNYRSAF